MIHHQIVTIGSGIIFLLIVLNLVVKKKMNEIFSIFWFFLGILFIVISVFEGLFFKLTYFIGAKYPASVLFFIGLMFVMILLVYLSVQISSLKKNNNKLSQELAILNKTVESLKECH